MNPRVLTVWVVSDGRAGIENQALGLAEAVARRTPAEIAVKRIRWRRLFDPLPARLKTRAMLDPASAPLGPPWPDLWIATGRASLPLSIGVRAWSGGRAFVVQTQDPRLPPSLFDLVVAPAHDRLIGGPVLSVVGGPHRITPQRLAEAAPAFADRIAPLPHPRVALLVGGRSAAYRMDAEAATRLGAQVAQAVRAAGGSVLATFSRRTPPGARRAFAAALAPLPGWVWDGSGDNPLFAFLHAADHILVTADSANMLAEAASTGRPVHRLDLPRRGRATKFDRLHQALAEAGAMRPFDGDLTPWTYAPLAETDRAAAAILARMAERDPG